MEDNFEERLAEEARRQEPSASERKDLRRRVLAEHARASRKVLLYNGVAHCILGFLLALSLGQFIGANGIAARIQFSTLAIITCMGLVVMKLWYWIVIAKLDILQELKLMRLREEGEPLATADFGSYVAKMLKEDPNYSRKLKTVLIACVITGYLVSLII